MFELTLAVREDPDEDTGLYESRCFQLGTASCGSTIEEAIRNIREACDLELSVFDTSSQLVNYLREHSVMVWTDGDAYREMDRMRGSSKWQPEIGVLAMPARFIRELTTA